MEVKIKIPDKLYRVLKESGKLALIQEWALAGIESMMETLYVGDLVE